MSFPALKPLFCSSAPQTPPTERERAAPIFLPGKGYSATHSPEQLDSEPTWRHHLPPSGNTSVGACGRRGHQHQIGRHVGEIPSMSGQPFTRCAAVRDLPGISLCRRWSEQPSLYGWDCRLRPASLQVRGFGHCFIPHGCALHTSAHTPHTALCRSSDHVLSCFQAIRATLPWAAMGPWQFRAVVPRSQ
jgi:hypothetical protein